MFWVFLMITSLAVVIIAMLSIIPNANDDSKISFEWKLSILIVGVLGLAVGALEIGNDSGESSARAPDLSGLCKAEQGSKLIVSWKVSGDDFEAVKKIVTEDAGCDVPVVHLKTPAAFSR